MSLFVKDIFGVLCMEVERKDIEELSDLLKSFISVDASNVDTLQHAETILSKVKVGSSCAGAMSEVDKLSVSGLYDYRIYMMSYGYISTILNRMMKEAEDDDITVDFDDEAVRGFEDSHVVSEAGSDLLDIELPEED